MLKLEHHHRNLTAPELCDVHSRCAPFKRFVRHEALEIERDAHAVSRERTPEKKSFMETSTVYLVPGKRGAARARTLIN